MKITIESADNGWIVHYKQVTRRKAVFSVPNNGGDAQEVETFSNVLWFINEQIGPTTGRYSPARIYVEVKPGDKYEDHLDAAE